MTGIIALILRLLLALSLYAFLGWALLVIYRDLQSASSKIISRQVPEITLTAEDGNDTPQTYHMPEITIGRDPGSDFELRDETVSSHHARFSYHHNQWWVEDLQSTNGTFLNDERVFTSTVIISGDELRLGKIQLMVSIKE